MGFRSAPAQARGFTLVELMIVVTIIAILVRISYPAYIKYVQQSNRADAKQALTNASQLLERCYSQYYSYLGSGTCLSTPFSSANNYYTITAPTLTATSYTLTATPIAGTVQAKDTQCTSFSITNTGLQTAMPTSNSTYCWTGHY